MKIKLLSLGLASLFMSSLAMGTPGAALIKKEILKKMLKDEGEPQPQPPELECSDFSGFWRGTCSLEVNGNKLVNEAAEMPIQMMSCEQIFMGDEFVNVGGVSRTDTATGEMTEDNRTVITWDAKKEVLLTDGTSYMRMFKEEFVGELKGAAKMYLMDGKLHSEDTTVAVMTAADGKREKVVLTVKCAYDKQVTPEPTPTEPAPDDQDAPQEPNK